MTSAGRTMPFSPTDLHGTAPNVNILKNDKKITKMLVTLLTFGDKKVTI